MVDTVEQVDVVVVGGGNAGFSAAHAAAGRGRRVVLLEKGEPDQAGGNSYYTAGAFRIAHEEAERAIGWRPEVGMREGLGRLIAWRDASNEGGTGR